MQVRHNSVLIEGNTTNLTTCFELNNTASNLVLKILNNIFSNTAPDQSGQYKHYCWISNSITSIGNAGSISDYNDLFVAHSGNGYTGLGLSTQYASLQNWKSAVNADQHSVAVNPGFISTTNLHIPASSITLLESGGTTAAGDTLDIDGDVRAGPVGSVNGGGFLPDIGADEFDGVPSSMFGPAITFTPITTMYLTGIQTLNAFATINGPQGVNTNTGTRPRIYYKKHSDPNQFLGNTNSVNGWKWTEATNNSSPFSFGINYSLLYTSLNVFDAIDYFVVAQDTATVPHISVNNGVLALIPSSVDLPPVSFPVLNTLNNYQIIPNFSGIKTIGIGGDYPNLTGVGGLFYALNLGTLTGNIEARIISDLAETGAYALNQLTCLGGNWNLIIRPDTSMLRTISGNYAGGLIRLNGTDRITFDGSFNGTGNYLKISNLASSGTIAAVQISSLGVGLGARKNTLRNCMISTGSSTSGTYAISIGAAIGVAGANNDSITIQNNIISNASNGIYAFSPQGSSQSQQLMISGNIIGSANEAVGINGIYLYGINNATVDRNEIRNMYNGSGNSSGIVCEQYTTNSVFSNNIIHGITSSSSNYVYGIYVPAGYGSANNTFIGNTIYDIGLRENPTYAVQQVCGIMMFSGSNAKVYYNSVYLSGTQPSHSSSGYYINAAINLSSQVSAITIKNNLFVNAIIDNSANSYNLAMYSYSNWPENDTYDYNDYYVSGAPNVVGLYQGNFYTTFNDFKAATGKDPHSFSLNPWYNSTKNLVLQPGSPVLNLGTPITGFTTDCLGNPRNAITPTPGAYEVAVDHKPPTIAYSAIPMTALTSNYILSNYFNITDNSGLDTAANMRPRLYYKKHSNANTFAGNTFTENGWKYVNATAAAPLFSFTMNYSLLAAGPAGGSAAGVVSINDTIDYFVTAGDASPQHNIATVDAVLNSTATSSLLTASNFPASGTRFFRIIDSIPASLTVGISGNYPNLTGENGLFKSLKNKVLTHDVIVKIKNNLVEDGLYPLEPFETNGPEWRLILRPDTSQERMVSGSYNGGLIRLAGADRITIDGSFQGSGHYLNIINTNMFSNPICVQLANTAEGSGATHNIIRNCKMSTINNTNINSFCIKVGGLSPLTAGLRNDSNLIENNIITKAYYGIVASGSDQNANTLITIRNNTIGDDIADNSISFNGINLYGFRRAIVDRNHIYNIQNATDYPVGIYLNRYVVNSLVNGNKIHNIRYTGPWAHSGLGIDTYLYMSGCNDTISNNMIWDIGGNGSGDFYYGAIAGMRITGYTGGIAIYHNTISLSGNYSGDSQGNLSAAIFVANNSPNLDIRNNIFSSSLVNVNCSQHKTYAIYSGNQASNFTIMDNNCYSAGGSQGMLAFIGVDRSTLDSLRLGFGNNIHSTVHMPDFYAAPVLGLYPNIVGNCPIDGKAALLPGIKKDLDGTPRGPYTPDIGADEFTSLIGLSIDASSNTAVAEGDTILLNAQPSGMTGYQWTGPNGFASNAQNPSITNASLASSGFYTLIITDTAGCSARDSVQVLILQTNSVSGNLHYLNNINTVLIGVKVILMNSLNQPLDSVLTDPSGHYSFHDFTTGNYHLKLVFPYPWSGGNSNDALLIMKHFVGIQSLSGLKLQAANVDLNQLVQSVDGLLIMRRFVNIINAFPTSDWVYDNTFFTASNNTTVLNVNCLCRGDVDGSYHP
ncbi:MAG: hypothetical protein WCO63_06450 [Bacteroidota bacterium]